MMKWRVMEEITAGFEAGEWGKVLRKEIGTGDQGRMSE